jgi:hypothetical protein
MKQCITIEQLKELDEYQINRLREWWFPVKGDKIAGHWLSKNDFIELQELGFVREIDSKGSVTGNGFILWNKNNLLPLLSVGQCISIIKDYTLVEGWNFEGINIGENNDVKLYNTQGERFLIFPTIQLIDTLWNAVKIVLTGTEYMCDHCKKRTKDLEDWITVEMNINKDNSKGKIIKHFCCNICANMYYGRAILDGISVKTEECWTKF